MAIKVPIISQFNDKGIKEADSKLKDFGKKAGLALLGTGVAAAALGTKLIAAGEDASTANARIGQIAESMGLFTKEITGVENGAEQVQKRLVALAEATARSTGVNQNAIKEAQGLLLTFGEVAKTADEAGAQFDRATKAAVDLAAAGFGSVTSNATQLGKALNDPIKGLSALSRSGVTFTETEKERIKTLVESNRVGEAQKLILEAIEKQVGGTAEATANASDKMAVGFSQITERLGLMLLPVFEKFVAFLADKVFPWVEKVIAIFEEGGLRGAINALWGTVKSEGPKILDGIVGFLGQAFDWIRNTGLPILWDNLQRLGAAIVDWIQPRIVPMLQALGEFIAAGAQWIINTGVPALWEKLQELGRQLIEWIEPRIVPMINKLGEFLGAALNWIIGTGIPLLAGKLFDLSLELWKWIIPTVPKVLRELGNWIIAIGEWFITKGIPAFIRYGVNIAGGLISGLFEALGKLVGRLMDFGRQIVSNIVSGIQSNVGSIASTILGAIPGVGAVTGAISGIRNILPFAEGGIVTRPTLGLVGEAGPEAVIPLNKAGMIGGGITINVAGSVIEERDLVERIRVGLLQAQRNGQQVA